MPINPLEIKNHCNIHEFWGDQIFKNKKSKFIQLIKEKKTDA
jgi:hypothetical protein